MPREAGVRTRIKLTISIPEVEVPFWSRVEKAHGFETRSAMLVAAVRKLGETVDIAGPPIPRAVRRQQTTTKRKRKSA